MLLNKNEEYFSDSYLKDLIRGWQVLKHEGRIITLIIPFAVTNLFYGISSVGMPYFASHYLSRSALSYGSLEFISSIGELLGSAVISHFSLGKNKLEKIVILCLFLAGLSVVFEALIASSMPVMILIFALSSAFWISIMNVNFQILIQESFSPHILGRIETINSTLSIV